MESGPDSPPTNELERLSSDLMSDGTIIAIASGTGAVGVIRISGPLARPILEESFRSPAAAKPADFSKHPGKLFYGDLIDSRNTEGRPESNPMAADRPALDDVLAVFYRGPASYTGEDVAEIFPHGNGLLMRQIADVLLDAFGATGLRPAQPGEFTKRAYLNGKLDLNKAEAIHQVITARSGMELEAGRKNAYGVLSRLQSKFRSQLIHLKAEVEAEIDFSDEDLTYESMDQRRARVADLLELAENILSRAAETDRLRSGIQVAIAGVPNAGKSSLLNQILGWDRALVSPQAGTTRDYLVEEIQLDGVPVRFVDTAGIRETEDVIEQHGVRMAMRTIQESEIILHVIDGAREAYSFPDFPPAKNLIHVFNKLDLGRIGSKYPEVSENKAARFIELSCKTGAGLSALKDFIKETIFGQDLRPDPLLLEDRHRHHFRMIQDALGRLLQLWDEGAPPEICALEIDRALEEAAGITGKIDNEEVLGRIFSVFCIGK